MMGRIGGNSDLSERGEMVSGMLCWGQGGHRGCTVLCDYLQYVLKVYIHCCSPTCVTRTDGWYSVIVYQCPGALECYSRLHCTYTLLIQLFALYIIHVTYIINEVGRTS